MHSFPEPPGNPPVSQPRDPASKYIHCILRTRRCSLSRSPALPLNPPCPCPLSHLNARHEAIEGCQHRRLRLGRGRVHHLLQRVGGENEKRIRRGRKE